MNFSIVTINLNSAADLGRTIESVVQQDFAEFEYVVLDGGSSDQSRALLVQYEDKIDRIETIEDAGIYSAMRQALPLCRGEYVLFMNAGDRFHSQKVLSRVAEAIVDGPDILYGDHIYSFGGNAFLHQAMHFKDIMELLEDGRYDHRTHGHIPCHQATFTRTHLLQRMPYDRNYQLCADHEFLMRAYSSGASFQYINEIICIYSGGGVSAQRTERLHLELSSAYRKFTYFPSHIDHMFGATARDLPSQNALTGLPLSGLGPTEGPFPEAGVPEQIRWTDQEGFSLISSSRRAKGLHMFGLNPIEGQSLAIIESGELLAQVKLEVGFCSVEVAFRREIAPLSVVEIEPEHVGLLSATDRRVSGFALTRFRFIPVRSPSTRFGKGEHLSIEAESSKCDEVLASGWSHVESTGVWSDGEEANLRFLVKDDVQRIALIGYYNPFVPVSGRQLSVAVNDSPAETYPVKQEVRICLDVHPSHSRNLLDILLRPLVTANAGQDKRQLGFFLARIEFL